VPKRHVRDQYAFRQVRHDPSEPVLFAPSLEDEVRSEPLVVALKKVVAELPNEVLERLYLPFGGVPYRPKELLAVWLFAFMQGERSSRRIQERVRWDMRFRYLAGGQAYDDRTIGRFLLRMEPALPELFAFIVEKLLAAGLVSKRCLAVDGTKIPGNVSQLKRAVHEASLQSDPDARPMGKRMVVGYNAQAAVDKDSGYVLGCEVVNHQADYSAMGPLLEALDRQSNLPEEVVADAGYESLRNLGELEERGITGYVAPKDDDDAAWEVDEEGELRCPAGHIPDLHATTYKHGVRIHRLRLLQCPTCPLAKGCGNPKTKTLAYPVGTDPRLRILNYKRARSDTGKALLIDRRTVERTFGHIKSNMRFSRFHLRGIAKARLEFGFACSAYNLRRYLLAAFWPVLSRIYCFWPKWLFAFTPFQSIRSMQRSQLRVSERFSLPTL